MGYQLLGLLSIISLFMVWITMPNVISYLKSFKIGQVIQADGPQHQHKAHTPTMGGLLIVLVTVALSIGVCGWYHLNAWPMMLIYGGVAMMGCWDDYQKIAHKNNDKGLSPRQKLQYQLSLSCAAILFILLSGDEYVAQIYVPGLSYWQGWYPVGYAYVGWVMLVVTATSNAVNLTDGLDGLVAPLITIVAVGMLILMQMLGADALHISQDKLWASSIILACLAGSNGGFWYYNRFPAKIFMGDSGSLSSGALLGFLACICHMEFVFALFASVFIMETLSVIIQVGYFKSTGKRFFKMAPLHHHFELTGHHETQVTRYFIITGMGFTALGLYLWLG